MVVTKHRKTDPACIRHRAPRTRLQWWWFDRGRGKACRPCMVSRRRAMREYLGLWSCTNCGCGWTNTRTDTACQRCGAGQVDGYGFRI